MKNIVKTIEVILIIGLLTYIILNWNNSKITVGHFFSLELLAILLWYEFDNFKHKNNGRQNRN
jgi:hypothetical protein